MFFVSFAFKRFVSVGLHAVGKQADLKTFIVLSPLLWHRHFDNRFRLVKSKNSFVLLSGCISACWRVSACCLL